MAQISTYEAIAQGMTAQHIANALQDYEPARSAFFVLKIAGLDNLLETNYTGGIADSDAPEHLMEEEWAEGVLTLSLEKCPVPGYEVGVGDIQLGNDTIHYATRPTFKSGGTFAFGDYVGMKTKEVLLAWKRLAYDDRTFKGGRMSQYKKTATLIEYTQDYEPIRTWKIYGLFIVDVQEADFDKSSNERRRMDVKFSFDRSVMEAIEEEAE